MKPTFSLVSDLKTVGVNIDSKAALLCFVFFDELISSFLDGRVASMLTIFFVYLQIKQSVW